MKLLIAAALVVTSAPVIAHVASEQDGATQAQPEQEHRICRRTTVQASQTRLGRGRLCLTAAQWRARSDMSTDDAMDGLDPMLRTQGRPVPTLSKGD